MATTRTTASSAASASYGSRSRSRSLVVVSSSLSWHQPLVLVLSLLCISTLPCGCHGMFPEEAGQLDFLVSTAGHGQTRFVYYAAADDNNNNNNNNNASSAAVLLTSDATTTTTTTTSTIISMVEPPSSSSCFLACRSAMTGSLLWRRNVCLLQQQQHHPVSTTAAAAGRVAVAMVAVPSLQTVISMDVRSGSVRSWNARTGVLQWETVLLLLLPPPPTTSADAATTSTVQLSIHEGGGEEGTTTTTTAWLRVSEQVRTKKMKTTVKSTDGDDDNGDDDNDDSNPEEEEEEKKEYWLDAKTGTILSEDDESQQKESLAALLSAAVVVSPTPQRRIDCHGTELSTALTVLPGLLEAIGGGGDGGEIESLFLVSSSSSEDLVVCDVVVSTTRSTTAYVSFHPARRSGDATTAADTAAVSSSLSSSLFTVHWTAEEGLASLTAGLILDASHFVPDMVTSAAVITTAEKMKKEKDVAEEDPKQVLSFASRLALQKKALKEWTNYFLSLFVTTTTTKADDNDNNKDDSTSGDKEYTTRSSGFGFEKIAVFVSETSHRLYGMYTAGPKRGQIKYHLDLPLMSLGGGWHKLIHGAPNAPKSVRGIHGKAHFPRQVLVVSYVPSSVSSSQQQQQQQQQHSISYTCIDGTTGQVFAQAPAATNIPISSKVSQLIPISLMSATTTAATSSSSHNSCRQGVILILEDLSTVVLPLEETDTVTAQIAAAAAGGHHHLHHGGGGGGGGVWFAHRWNTDTNNNINNNNNIPSMESLRLTVPKTTTDSGSSSTSSITTQVMGMAQFPEETVLRVAYPNREEVIQSPCNVLGDQSLLLKYLNPHLVVLMTTTNTDTTKDPFTKAFLGTAATTAAAAAEKKQKRKPLGVGVTPEETKAAAAASDATTTTIAMVEDPEPNLFINVMDTVSGRVLYRASHANAMISSSETSTSLLVSENWIFYSFLNAKTRRAELGVLSLYEGMVDPKGLTAFSTTLDQSKLFSSLDARETKPVVLAKTYSLSKPITALGITTTRNGISGKKLVVATLDGALYTVDRKIVEPRRPMGQVKDTEQQEGLRQYSELIPLISYASLTYTQQVQGVKYILSAPTDLESQTIVVAFGGPDIFVTRTSPSRGFDLLPDSFSRVLLTLIVVVLIALYLVLQRIVFTKTVEKGWM